MKKFFLFLTISVFASQLSAQTNGPVRLALISETGEASAASDILTAQLSGNPKIQLLERNEIEKVYREQGLSAGNKDYLKLGKILGADGLLLFDVVRTPQATNLLARLIAVKPGVVLTDGSFPWPLKDTAQWAESASTYLDSFLPKLLLLPKDAIPISVVNLRSAILSGAGAEAERQLKLLTIQRLSREPQFFVLERQKMQLLGEEKELKLDDSAFWNGSYLLEGVIDQNGYSKNTITINARLTPPKGAAPLLMEVSGSRTNLAEVIDQLAVKVNEALKVNSTVKEWNSADEATQYFNEAKWALRWGVFPEAQAAADSAWALGKQDMDCAIVRVKSYVLEVAANVGGYETLEQTFGAEGGYNADGSPRGDPPNEAEIQSEIKTMLAQHPWGMAYRETQDDVQKAKTVHYVFTTRSPDPKNIERALHALELYYEFSQTSTDAVPKILWRGAGWNDWHNSDWYNLGIEDLVAASRALQDFNLAPFELQKPVSEKLAELRTLSRSVAELISRSPSVHDSYFVGDRIVTYDELIHTIGEENPKNSNIFRCKVEWGCFWQEKPEDGLTSYRELMSSPVFCYIHKNFWFRELASPRLIAWNEQDQKHIPTLWNNFAQELNNSTNLLLQMEAKALLKADAKSDVQAKMAQDEWWSIVRSNREELIANNVDLFYSGWGFGYIPEIQAMEQEYREKTAVGQKTQAVFEKQKQFLKANQPYDFMEFVNTFREKDYSKAQALEIQPLIAAYKSNLMAQSAGLSGMDKGKNRNAIAQVGFLEKDVERILNPPVPQLQQQAQAPKSAPITKPVVVTSAPTNAPEIVTNVITVSKFFAIPLDSLYQLQGSEKVKASSATITAHHWFEGKLLLDFRYSIYIELRDEKGVLLDNRPVAGDAIAIFNPVTERWSVVDCPKSDGISHIMSQNNFYHRSALLNGELFTCDEKQIKKYDVQNQRWNLLSISDGNNYELFAVNSRLYAANQNTIFEILDGGNSTHILASNRRQPPASSLDAENLGTPTLFAGSGQSLRAAAANKIVAWSGEDWRTICPAPQAPTPPVISDEGVLFLANGWNAPAGIWRLATESDQVEFCLGQQTRQIGAAGSSPDINSNPAWKLPPEFSLPRLPAASRGSDLYLMADHARSQDIVNEQEHLIIGKNILPQDGYHAELLCFASHYPAPQKIFLKFDNEDASLPVIGDEHSTGFMPPGTPSSWLLFSPNYLFCGKEISDGFPGGGGDKTGVWMISLEQIDPEIARQKKVQQAQLSQSDALAKQTAQAWLEKFDHNHNGVIDPDEKEAALDDPAFITPELDTIDTNHNGWLEAAELAYFDANTNKILESKEQAGIELVQHLLAEKLLKKFDVNGDGLLDRREFDEMSHSIMETGIRSMPGLSGGRFVSPGQFVLLDLNHDNYLDPGELENVVKDQTRGGLRLRGMPGATVFNQMRTNGNQPVDIRQTFKLRLEFYWQNPGGITNRPPFQNGMPPGGGGGVPNRMPVGLPP